MGNYDTNQNNKKFIAFFINDDGKMSVRINIKNIITDYTVVDFKNKILKNGDKKMFFIVERKVSHHRLGASGGRKRKVYEPCR